MIKHVSKIISSEQAENMVILKMVVVSWLNTACVYYKLSILQTRMTVEYLQGQDHDCWHADKIDFLHWITITWCMSPDVSLSSHQSVFVFSGSVSLVQDNISSLLSPPCCWRTFCTLYDCPPQLFQSCPACTPSPCPCSRRCWRSPAARVSHCPLSWLSRQPCPEEWCLTII